MTTEQVQDARCAVCGHGPGNTVHVAREMMFGLRERFRYLECAACGCVQLLDVPADFAKYYPPTYYSFAPESGLKARLNAWRARQAFGRPSVAGWLTEQLLGPYYALQSLCRADLPLDARILDVGCGAGSLIRDMKDLGFPKVEGLDPFIAADIHHANGATVWKRSVADMQGPYDVVMLHHAFEHMPQPAATLRDLARLLAPGGRLILRVPVAGSDAWRRYGVNWMHLDAPRHLFLHTPASMRVLAGQTGLTLVSTRFEGNPTQFIGSEQYARDIPLADPRSVYSGSWRRWIGWWQGRRLAARAEALNASGQGDWACFELRPAPAATNR